MSARIADESVGVYCTGLVKNQSRKTTLSSYLMLVATGYVRLATLEWANEVVKAARGTTSVATIELPAHASTCATLSVETVRGRDFSSVQSGLVTQNDTASGRR